MDQVFVPLAILGSSFLGSWHCAGMCGPFAALTGSRGQLWHYHLGRLLVYTTLGATAGWFGEFVFKSEFKIFRAMGATLLGVLLIALGLQYLLGLEWGKNSHHRAGKLFWRLYVKIKQFKLSQSSFVIGLMAGFLPCMWLYSYVVAASATQSAYAGALTLFLFWLGGLPALSAVSMMIRPSLLRSTPRKQKIAGVVLVIAGFWALASHFLA